MSRRSERYVRRLAALATKVRIEAGDPVAHVYELCDRFAVVRSGKCIVEESTAAGSATAEQHAHSNHPPMPEPPLVARSARLIAQSAVVTHDDVVKTTSA